MKKISILAVNFYGDKFRDLLIKSIKENISCEESEYEILIHDNSKELNIGHGRGMDKLIHQAEGRYIFTFDIDAHVLLKNFDKKIIAYYEKEAKNKLRLIAGEGGQLKPVRPCCMFFEKEFFIKNEMSFVAQNLEGVKFDVGVHFYFKTLSLGYGAQFFKQAKTEFKEVLGNEYLFEGERFCYHHWYATRWVNGHGKRVRDVIDGLKFEDWQKSTNNLFKQKENE